MGGKSRTVFESVKPEIPNVRGSFGPDSGRRDGASGRLCHSRRPLGTGRCRPEAGGGVEGRSRRLPGVPASGLGSQGEERGPAGETKGGRGGWRTAGVTGPGVTGPRAGCCRTLFGCDKTATEPLNSASWWSLVTLTINIFGTVNFKSLVGLDPAERDKRGGAGTALSCLHHLCKCPLSTGPPGASFISRDLPPPLPFASHSILPPRTFPGRHPHTQQQRVPQWTVPLSSLRRGCRQWRAELINLCACT